MIVARNTRGKGKKRQLDRIEDEQSEVLRNIFVTGEVTKNDVNLLFSLRKAPCHGCRGNSKESPNCFCGLVPQSVSSKGKGIWKTMPDVIQELGEDPNELLRPGLEHPVGLTNLGATCYVNSILQCLFMNARFRNGVFSIEHELLSQQPVLYQLSRLFAQLHSGKRSVIEPIFFIKALALDSAIQQDSHEFFTLLLTLLEDSLKNSSNPKVKSLVEDLFQGSSFHVTCCSVCGKKPKPSGAAEGFRVLELNIEGLKNLEESLDYYLSVQHLKGNNQYYCDTCKQHVDATCSVELHTLPPLLTVHFKRYSYSMTGIKRKITSKFSFPKILNMGHRLQNNDNCDRRSLIYDLSAILMHKGGAVNSGHYVAHIKDEYTGIWWEFDDEKVTKLGLHPFGMSSNGDSKVSSKSVGTDTASASSLADLDMFSSSDAYMLMYTCTQPADVGKCTVPLGVDGAKAPNATCCSLPEHLYAEVDELNHSFLKCCEDYRTKKDELSKLITARKHEVKTVLSEAPVHGTEQPFYWISSHWLRQWASDDYPPCISNGDLQCEHGRVSPSKLTMLKRVSTSAWSRLQSKHGGGPTLSDSDYCIDCIKEMAKTVVSATSYRDKRYAMKEAVESELVRQCMEGKLYIVSKPWLTQWLRRKIVDAPCDGDAGPTAALICPHGLLQPEQAPGARRQLIPEYIWNYFLENAHQVEPDNPAGHTSFSADSEPCDVCFQEITKAVSLKDHLRASKIEQRQRHEHLLAGKNIAVLPGCRYYLLPLSWLMDWRAYLTITGKNASTVEEPENLGFCLDSVLCEKHAQLLYRPPLLVRRKHEFVQKLSNSDVLSIITEEDWRYFCEEWNVPEDKAISVIIDFEHLEGKNSGHCSDMPISVDESNLDNSDRGQTGNLHVRTEPSICKECIEERESCELMRKLEYTNEEIQVHLVRGKEPPRSLLVVSSIDVDRRASKRTRRSTPNGSIVKLTVSGNTSIYQLKMMIWERLGVVKENQKLHKGSRELTGEDATLADLNVFAGDTLWLIDTEIHEDRDIMDEITGNDTGNEALEEGFKGTLLASTVPGKVF